MFTPWLTKNNTYQTDKGVKGKGQADKQLTNSSSEKRKPKREKCKPLTHLQMVAIPVAESVSTPGPKYYLGTITKGKERKEGRKLVTMIEKSH